MADRKKIKRKERPKHPVRFKRKLVNFFVYLFVITGMAVLYYFIFSFFFDTPVEYGMKRSVDKLEREYEKLQSRYDTLDRVINNITDRDKEIFYALFDSYPLDDGSDKRQFARYDSLLGKTNKELGDEFLSRLEKFGNKVKVKGEDLSALQERVEARGNELNKIPSIQPIINKELTLVATSFGMRIHPFYKTLVQHNGTDYAVTEGTRVFATADGYVSSVREGLATTGRTVVINHENGYETSYNHLGRALIRPGMRVKRGDIIALTGNTGLSLAPHLHYEIRYNGAPVDPVHYFFYELGPRDYGRIKRIASVGMQSFD